MTPLVGLLVGVVFIVLGVPLFLRLVPPNGLYGLRVSATEGDEFVWYEANRRAGRDLALVGMVLLVVAVWLWREAGASGTSGRWLIAVEFLGILAVAAKGVFVANRLAGSHTRR